MTDRQRHLIKIKFDFYDDKIIRSVALEHYYRRNCMKQLAYNAHNIMMIWKRKQKSFLDDQLQLVRNFRKQKLDFFYAFKKYHNEEIVRRGRNAPLTLRVLGYVNDCRAQFEVATRCLKTIKQLLKK